MVIRWIRESFSTLPAVCSIEYDFMIPSCLSSSRISVSKSIIIFNLLVCRSHTDELHKSLSCMNTDGNSTTRLLASLFKSNFPVYYQKKELWGIHSVINLNNWCLSLRTCSVFLCHIKNIGAHQKFLKEHRKGNRILF